MRGLKEGLLGAFGHTALGKTKLQLPLGATVCDWLLGRAGNLSIRTDLPKGVF